MLRPLLLFPLLVFSACDTAGSVPDADPQLVQSWVCDGLEEAAAHAKNGNWENAEAAFSRAELHFEEQLEPRLRRKMSPRAVVGIEHQWALAKRGLRRQAGETARELDAMAVTLREGSP